MITGKQCRAARALLDLTRDKLAELVKNPARNAIKNFEAQEKASKKSIENLKIFFENRGIEFLPNNGVAFKPEIRTYQAAEGFRLFMDDLYETARDTGGDICLFNSNPSLWIKHLGQDWYDMHAERMAALGDRINVRITLEEGKTDFILDIAQHRWVPELEWKEKIVYVYGDKLAFLQFPDDDVKILVLHSEGFAEAFRKMFDITWKNAAVPPRQEES